MDVRAASAELWPQRLEPLDFLGLLETELRDEIVVGAVRMDVPASSILYRPGEGMTAYIVSGGLVRAFYVTADGRQPAWDSFTAARWSDCSGSLRAPAEVFLQTLTDTSVLRLDAHRVLQLATENPEMAMALGRHAAHLAFRALHLVAVRSLGSMRDRLACDLLERACQRQLRTGRLDVMMSHADLADSVGGSREGTTRALPSLRSSGLVRTERGRISLLDPVGLAAIESGFVV
jgi:CRP-like cAMP-binding protein